jgi:hypothetical protein
MPRNEPGPEARTQGMRLPAISSGPHPAPSVVGGARKSRRTRRNLPRGARCRGTKRDYSANPVPPKRRQRTRRRGCVPSKFSCSAKGESVFPCRVPHMRPAASESGESAPESALQAKPAWGDRGANPVRNSESSAWPCTTRCMETPRQSTKAPPFWQWRKWSEVTRHKREMFAPGSVKGR